MKAIEAYKRFQLKVNKLDSADNIDISPGEFVLMFNENQVKWYEDRYQKAQALSNNNFKLENPTIHDRFVEYILPDNYITYIRGYALCSSGNCKDRVVRFFEIPLQDVEEYLRDDSNKPSFEYQETPVTISSDKLQVYKTDFNIESVFFTYYRYPVQIDIQGYIRLDGNPSTNVDPEFADEFVNEIVDMCVLDVQRTFENQDGFKLSEDRVNNNNNNNK